MLVPLAVLPVAVVLLSAQQTKLYQASAQVLLSSQNLAAELTGTQNTGINLQPDRIAQTQADVARVREVARRALAAVPEAQLSPDGLLSISSVHTSSDTDVLAFDVTNADPALARRLVNAYAAAYTQYRRELDTSSILKAISGVAARLRQLTAGGDTDSSLYKALVDRQETLATMQALQTSNATVIERATGTIQVQPRPVRNGMLGLVLGVIAGIAGAFLWDALDSRVRSAEEVGKRLGDVPLLARLAAPKKRLRQTNKLVMLEEPLGPQAEAFRMLATNLEFVAVDREIRTILVTSGLEQEGKSTTAANLAVALARAGKRVVLADLDLRRPFAHRFFEIHGLGITQVVLGHQGLDDALVPVSLLAPGRRQRGRAFLRGSVGWNGAGDTADRGEGALLVLPAGPLPPNPGEFVGTQAMSDVFTELRERADIVIVDAPPMLSVGDVARLSSNVDGILVVTRLNSVRRPMLQELVRQLATVPTPVLGFVATGADEEEGYGYGYGYGYGHGKYSAADERVSEPELDVTEA